MSVNCELQIKLVVTSNFIEPNLWILIQKVSIAHCLACITRNCEFEIVIWVNWVSWPARRRPICIAVNCELEIEIESELLELAVNCDLEIEIESELLELAVNCELEIEIESELL